jgi:hypothetical protein
MTFACTADAAGAFTPITLPRFAGTLLALTTEPADPEPSDGFDVALVDAAGTDLLGDCGAGRSGHVDERRMIRTIAGIDLHPSVTLADALTLTVSGRHVPGAVLLVTITYAAS